MNTVIIRSAESGLDIAQRIECYTEASIIIGDRNILVKVRCNNVFDTDHISAISTETYRILASAKIYIAVSRNGEYNIVTISNISIRNLKDDIRIIFNNNNNSYMVVNPCVNCNKTLALTETDAKTMERKAIIKAMICFCVEANKFPTA